MKIYAASKIWHAPAWQKLRAEGFDLTSRWIDYDENHPIVQDKPTLWQHCLEDVTEADCMILFCGAENEEQRGTIMEAGHAIGQGKPVYCINTCRSFTACDISDVAFTHHPLWNWIRQDGEYISIEDGVQLAYMHARRYELQVAAKKGGE